MTSDSPDPSDQDLLGAWQAGDLAAGNAFVERYFVMVYRFFVTKVPAEADDLTQQTFADLQKAVGRLAEVSRGRAYVMKIARNRLYMFLRSRAVRDRVFNPEVMSVSAIDVKPSPSGALAQRRDVRQLIHALRTIPVDAQVVLELYYWEELPVRDIADIVGVAEGTVMSRLYRARDKLNRALAASTDDEGLVGRTAAGLETWAREIREAFIGPTE